MIFLIVKYLLYIEESGLEYYKGSQDDVAWFRRERMCKRRIRVLASIPIT